MKYFTHTVQKHIVNKITAIDGDGSGRRILIMIPDLPEKNLLALADSISSYCLKDPLIDLNLKIAKISTDVWTTEGREKAEAQGWLDDRGSLTYYRNLPPTDKKLSLIILCGTDLVTDTGGLGDFHTLDLDSLWRTDMNKSFQDWVIQKLNAVGIHDVGSAELAAFDTLLGGLLACGRADLLRISDWLSDLGLSHIDNVRQAQGEMLRNLRGFGLPLLIGFDVRGDKNNLRNYIDKAGAFYSYTEFLEAREREKAESAIDKLLEALRLGDDTGVMLEDEDVRGPYSSGEAFLAGLKNYILTDNSKDRDKLFECDFVTIHDKILKFRKRGAKKKESTYKVSGSPIEMVLTSLWKSLQDYYRTVANDASQINEIKIEHVCFKHDLDGTIGEGAFDAFESAEIAREYLSHLIGGLDDLVDQHLSLTNINNQEIKIKCSLMGDDIDCKLSRTAEPSLEFSIYISSDDGAGAFQRKFAWRLPENHSYRLAHDLLRLAKGALASQQEIRTLPVFHIPYFDEVLSTTSDEQTRAVFMHSIRDARLDGAQNEAFITNLLSEEWLKSNEPLLEKLKLLAERYHIFINATCERGLLGALFGGNEWADLRHSLSEACDDVARDSNSLRSSLAGMLVRAFLVIQRRKPASGVSWHAEPYEQSGLLTVLHPALLEMLQAQVLYQFSCFNYSVNREIKADSRNRAFRDRIWRIYLDLSSVQAPLSGLLRNEELILDTNIRGQDLIHKIGSPSGTNAALSTRLLLRYGDGESDEAFSDNEMFQETSESKLVLRLFLDYFRLHPHAADGLSIAVFRNKDIQPIVAAVHHYLKILADRRQERYYVLTPERRRPYAIGVTIFTNSSDDTDVSRWIEQWQERWEAAETEAKYKPYRKCRFSVAHRLVENGDQEAFRRLIDDSFTADIAFLYDFIGAGSGVNRFETVEPFDLTSRTLKFPILEKACCLIDNPAEKWKRERVISNRQFVLGAQHANLMHSLKSQSLQQGAIVVGKGDFAPWRDVLDKLHEKTEWVVCVDPNMDERLIKEPASEPGLEREIIGFGSGVGTHGEDNYTISTEQFLFADVRTRMGASIKELYAGCGWSEDENKKIASGVLTGALKLSGLSLVRATGVDDNYIHDFMAYALTRKMLRAGEGAVLCDNLVSLDAYRHWFDLAEEEQSRPDLMWLKARLGEDKRLHLEMHLIECKMARESEAHLVKARSQINNGLQTLMEAFAPLEDEGSSGREDFRPDRRYWWMQLHRLIASKAEISQGQYTDVLSALERLAEGDYDIDWNAAVFAFWIDSSDAKVRREGHWTTGPARDISAGIYTMGSEFVKRLAENTDEYPLSWSEFELHAEQTVKNVCETMEDVEMSAEDDDEADSTSWEDGGPDGEEADEDRIDFGDGDAVAVGAITNHVKHYSQEEIGTEVRAPSDLDEADAKALESNEVLDPRPTGAAALEIPERILLGTRTSGDRPVYWEFGHKDLANRHMLIFGTSGMGKTYAIQCLLCELARAGQNSLIVDYTDGFIPSKIEPSAQAQIKNEGQNFILKAPLPINPFKAQVSYEMGMEFADSAQTIAKRVASIFKSVYELGAQQFPLLIDAIMEGIEENGDGFNLNKLLLKLESYVGDGRHPKASVQTTLGKLKPFISTAPFSQDGAGVGWQELFTDKELRNCVFQFHKVDKHSARALIEFVLWDMYAFVVSTGRKDLPRVLVLDEVQNLDLGEDTPVAKYLTEGRKHGVALITATQTVKGVGGVSDARVSRLFQAEQKLFFKPTENEMQEHAKLLHYAVNSVSVKDWAGRLASLQKGECWTLGRSLNEATGRLVLQAQKIKITSLEERGFNGKETSDPATAEEFSPNL